MGKPDYKLSFTAASLSLNESVSIAEIFLKSGDWDQTKKIIRENNLLQSRTTSRTVRVVRELIQRLSLLSGAQLELLVEGNPVEQKYLLWFAVCKTYQYVHEFAVEVLHEKYLSRSLKFTELDYDAFYNRKADWNDDLNRITSTTRKKIRQVLLLMVREAGLVTDDNLIVHAILSGRLVEALRPDAPTSYQIFPVDPF